MSATRTTVYVIGNGSRMKIGLTSNAVKRLASLQTASSTKLRVIHGHACDDAHLVEAIAHHLLRAKRSAGEWFDVSAAQASAAILQAIKMVESGDVALLDDPNFRRSAAGRKMEYPERITLPLADGTKARIDALLVEGEARLDLIREGIEREIKEARAEATGEGAIEMSAADYAPPNEDPFVLGPVTISNAFMDSVRSERRTLSIFGLKMLWPFPIARSMGSSCAVVFGWPLYGADCPGWVNRVGALFRWAYDARWKFRHRWVPRHQYNIIRTDLRPGYYDEDTLILASCMKLLCRYVESHGGADELQDFTNELVGSPDLSAPDGMGSHQITTQDEAVMIYRWWKVERPADERRRDELCHKLFGGHRVSFSEPDENGLCKMVRRTLTAEEASEHKVFRELERKIADDEQAMLHRLIDIRQGLWT